MKQPLLRIAALSAFGLDATRSTVLLLAVAGLAPAITACGVVTVQSGKHPPTAAAESRPVPPTAPERPKDAPKEVAVEPTSELGGMPPGNPKALLADATAAVEAMKTPPKSGAHRYSAEVDLYRVRTLLIGLPSTDLKDQALALWSEAKSLAKDIPPNVGSTDEARSEHFREILRRFEEMRWKIDKNFLAGLDFFVSAIETELAAHERSELDGAESARGRAVLDEARSIVKLYAKGGKRQETAIARLNANPAYKRLSSEQQRLRDLADQFATDLGEQSLASEAVCAKSSLANQRLCKIYRRFEVLDAQILQMEKRAGTGGT